MTRRYIAAQIFPEIVRYWRKTVVYFLKGCKQVSVWGVKKIPIRDFDAGARPLKSLLTFPEKDLIKSHGFSESDVHDGRNESPPERHDRAKKSGKALVLRDPSGSKCGHRITTRNHHCIHCNPARLGYQKRHRVHGAVYIAGSPTSKLLKVGFTEREPSVRIESLAKTEYGGISDWLLLFSVSVDEGGRIEGLAHKALNKFLCKRAYEKDGETQEAKEIFRCSFQSAYAAVAKSITASGLKPKQGTKPYRNAPAIKKHGF